MFLLANAVDDADMGITHVIRGEEHVNGTPKYLLIRRGARASTTDRCSPTCRSSSTRQRKKLSKRRDDVSVADFRDEGYLPEAMVNYLALLGWGPPDGVEVRPLAEIVELFRLEDVTPSPAFFDMQEAGARSTASTSARSPPTSSSSAAAAVPHRGDAAVEPLLAALAPLVQERVRTLAEVEPMVDFLLDWPSRDRRGRRGRRRSCKGKALADDARRRRSPAGPSCSSGRPTRCEAIERGRGRRRLVNAEGKPSSARPRHRSGWRSRAARSARRCSSRSRLLGRERTLDRLRAARARL